MLSFTGGGSRPGVVATNHRSSSSFQVNKLNGMWLQPETWNEQFCPSEEERTGGGRFLSRKRWQAGEMRRQEMSPGGGYVILEIISRLI